MTPVGQIRDGIAARLALIDGLRVSAHVPDAPRPPLATVLPERITFDVNARRGLDTLLFVVLVMVGRASDRGAQTQLDALISGPNNVKDTLEGDRTLGGIVDTLRVTEMRNYSMEAVGDTIYLTAQFVVEVSA